MAEPRIFMLVGDHPRHLYYLRRIVREFNVLGALIQQREHMIPAMPKNVAERDRENFRRHFKERQEAEHYHFGASLEPTDIECRKFKDLHDGNAVQFFREHDPNIVLIFGTDMIRGELFNLMPFHTINMHLGLSPRYRGAATLFWPFYFLEPAYAGVTFHRITDEPDAGEIIHQCRPPLDINDGTHDVGVKAVSWASGDMIRLLNTFREHGGWEMKKQTNTGKVFLASDFVPQHLRMIYDVYDNQIVRNVMTGEIPRREPVLFSNPRLK